MQTSTTVSCSKQNLARLRSFLHQCLSKLTIPEEQIYLLVLAVDEVCSNLIIHTHHCDPSKSFEVILKTGDKEGRTLIFEIKDDGLVFNPDEHPTSSMDEVVANKQKGGMGLILVKEIMDQIEVESMNGTNIYRFYKYPSNGSVKCTA